jgi:hypothetical protein
MTGHELKPGDAVRFTSTGQIGVVESVKSGIAHVWILEWVARTPPVLIKCMCALESLTWIHRAGEIEPASVRPNWRDMSMSNKQADNMWRAPPVAYPARSIDSEVEMEIKPEQVLLASRLAADAAEVQTEYIALLLIGGVETARLVLTTIASLETTIAKIKKEACELLPYGDSMREESGK